MTGLNSTYTYTPYCQCCLEIILHFCSIKFANIGTHFTNYYNYSYQRCFVMKIKKIIADLLFWLNPLTA